ncbi:hypothetical protein TASIC1_0001048100 [Trichoderma asperellum]|uniref:Uncharacterized protein n=1 Tax=Trichoderma asperellum TaxID=101201 RepID=A0A6V8QJ92_TRIAP|nr:hypothetical protein LI328DRAFT_3972 [Trichoderma asperelloides]GFP52329.1 hypothetical protein TASIC1_0001048100 [Trichoderma asperellum]
MASLAPKPAVSSIPPPNDVPNASPTDSPNGGSLNGNGDTISGGGAGQDTSSSMNIFPSASPTPAPSNPGLLPPASTTILSFNNTANFGTDITGRVFDSEMQTKLFSWTYDSSNTKLLDIFWYGKNYTGEPFNTSQATVIASAEFDGPTALEFSKLTALNAVLNLTAPHVKNWYEKEMVIKIEWRNQDEEQGFSQSGVFTVAKGDDPAFSPEEFGRNATRAEQDRQGFESITSQGNQSSSPAPTDVGRPSGSSSSSGGGGLSTGAIAGIAVACSVVGIALIAGLVWFLLRRRRRSVGEGYKATRQTTNSFTAVKEARPSVAESPIVSPFSDDGETRGFSRSNIAIALPQRSTTTTRAAVPAPNGESRADRPESAASGNRPRGIAHLVEEGMTEADILRLEEEERHLDAEIERAARRGSS